MGNIKVILGLLFILAGLSLLVFVSVPGLFITDFLIIIFGVLLIVFRDSESDVEKRNDVGRK